MQIEDHSRSKTRNKRVLRVARILRIMPKAGLGIFRGLKRRNLTYRFFIPHVPQEPQKTGLPHTYYTRTQESSNSVRSQKVPTV